MRIYVTSMGCKLNQSEMDRLALRMTEAGHQVVTTPADAELCILNTCAVTHVAAQKSRQALRRMHRQNPGARLIATGCYAELAPNEISRLPEVETVVGNRDKEHPERWLGDPALEAGGPSASANTWAPTPHPRTRALIKIQDGCNNGCTYCIIHVARGPQQSQPPETVMDEVRARLAEGYHEIVLTGVHIGAYGRDRPGVSPSVDLWGLVGRILEGTNVPRLRLSSIEPWDLSQDAFPLWADPRLCRHLHLPLQSGSDTTLRRMARRYTTGEFAALVASARAAIPGLAVTTDVIVGFPGESSQDFEHSLAFVRAMQFARVHVFPYSARPGTPAAQMPDQVLPSIKAERAQAMRTAAESSDRTFRQQFVGQTASVLWESCHWQGSSPVWSGLTDNYLRVYLHSTAELANVLTPTRLVGLEKDGLQGQIEAAGI
jgi:threonylcarbamoyladenosine tRNA methylthiotransferase MtaB